jgi:hypothetical protein
MSPEYVRPYVKAQKNNDLDTEAMTKVMRAATRLHRHDAALKTQDIAYQLRSTHPTSQNDPTRRVQTRQAAGVLAKINAKDHYTHRFAPFTPSTRMILTDCRLRGGPLYNHMNTGAASAPARNERRSRSGVGLTRPGPHRRRGQGVSEHVGSRG